MLSRQDFTAVAKVLKTERESLRHSTSTEPFDCLASNARLIRALADYFATTNQRFDRARFLRACGLPNG